MSSPLIKNPTSLIINSDLPLGDHLHLVRRTRFLPYVGGYRIGATLALKHGLGNVIGLTKELTEKPIIYDHQKAGTDSPSTGIRFAKMLKQAKIDALLLVPMAGPLTAEHWIKACQDQEIHVIVGMVMTHQKYLYSEGGYIINFWKLFLDAYKMGVRDFEVPGSNHPMIRELATLLNDKENILYVSESKKASKYVNHYITGDDLYHEENIIEALETYASMVLDQKKGDS